MNSAWSVGKTYVATALNAPVVTLSGNTASWLAENAASYVYKIGINGEEIATAETSKTLTHGQTIYVKAIGDNEQYLNSAWSVGKTYEATALTAPVVTLNGNAASWTAVDGATGYVYKIGATGVETAATGTTLTLTHGQTIYVKAVDSNGVKLGSAWSIAVTYRNSLTAPVVTLNGNTASWAAVSGATGYVYKIDGGEQQTAEGTSVTLQDGQSIEVKALGDGTTCGNSGWSTAITYTENSGNTDNELDGIYTGEKETSDGCGSVVGTLGVTAMLAAAGVCLVLKRRGEEEK